MSHENPEIEALYKVFLREPLSETSHGSCTLLTLDVHSIIQFNTKSSLLTFFSQLLQESDVNRGN